MSAQQSDFAYLTAKDLISTTPIEQPDTPENDLDQSTEELARDLMADMYRCMEKDNSIVLAQLGPEMEPVQVQLIVTRDPEQFLDNT